MSTYVAFYTRTDSFGTNRPYVRYIGKGFSCTRDELPNEMKIRCRSAAIPEYTWVSSKDAADVLIQNAKDRGFTIEIG